MQAFLSQELDKEYPLPNKKGWEEQYRYAKALEKASEIVIAYFTGLNSQYTMLLEKEKSEEPDIQNA
jgi:hypothetical protein